MSEFCSRSISLEQMDRLGLNFVYAFILARSMLELLPVIFPKFVTELWPMIDIRISFLLNILGTNHIDKIYAGIVTCHF